MEIDMLCAHATLAGPMPTESIPIKEQMPRPNPWWALFMNAQTRVGYYPARGYEWRHSFASYDDAGDEKENQRRHDEAKERLADLLQQTAKEMGGEPGDWKVILLKGWEMHHTVADGKHFLDCTYAVVPKGVPID